MILCGYIFLFEIHPAG